jgi:hypothetical protein
VGAGEVGHDRPSRGGWFVAGGLVVLGLAGVVAALRPGKG